MKHKVLSTGVHCILDSDGRVHVYTENEYYHQEWWLKIKSKYKLI